MKVAQYKNIELITAYEKMTMWEGNTYDTAQTLAKVKTGREYVYIMPFGVDYECEGGHHCEILSQSEFDNLYSVRHMKNGQFDDGK